MKPHMASTPMGVHFLIMFHIAERAPGEWASACHFHNTDFWNLFPNHSARTARTT